MYAMYLNVSLDNEIHRSEHATAGSRQCYHVCDMARSSGPPVRLLSEPEPEIVLQGIPVSGLIRGRKVLSVW